MHKFGTKVITKAAVAAVATSLIFGGAQVFAAERIADGETVRVDLDGYNTKTNYTFVPQTDGDYMFTASDPDNDRMSPSIRIYQGSTLIGEFGSGCEFTLEGLEAGRSYQIQARETGLRRGQEGSYDLSIINVTQVAPDYGMEDIIDTDDSIDTIIYIPVHEDETDDTIGPIVFDLDNNSTPAPAAASVTETVTAVAGTEAEAAPSLVAPSQQTMVEGFVNRLYVTVLNRQPDQAGMTYWVSQLTSGKISGSTAAENFLNSQEFLNKDLDDEDFVEVLYTVFFNRVPSEAEADNWEDALENGATRAQVIAGFTGSSEWSNTCAGFGIVK